MTTLLLVAVAVTVSPRSTAGGVDSFLWYSARHLGLGGAAVSYASDPTAIFHNPAGLSHIEEAELLLTVGFLSPELRSAPAEHVNVYAEPTTAAFGFAGGAIRLNEWLSVGFAAYPIAAAGASYRYESVVGETKDESRALLVEASPALAFTLPHGFGLGVGYRMTAMTMRRYARGAAAETPGIEMNMTGFDWGGVRVGTQWSHIWQESPIERRSLQLGASHRHMVRVPLRGTGGYALATRLDSLETTFILPSKSAVGARADWGRVGATLDFEYGFNSQNGRSVVRVQLEDGPEAELPNILEWKDTPGVRGGLEYRALDNGQMPIRIGYAFDGTTINREYPTAFGPPPTSTQMLTCGIGYAAGPWQVDAAYSYRFGSSTVTARDVEGSDLCAFCGFPGEYEVQIHGLYFDLSYTFGE